MTTPGSTTKMSMYNRCMAGTVSYNEFGTTAGWPVSNILQPQRPFLQFLGASVATASAGGNVVVDFGSSFEIGLVVVVNHNLPYFTVALEDSYGDGAYVHPYQYAGYDLWTAKYQNAIIIDPPQTRRYLRLYMPGGTLTWDTVRIGGIWAGPRLVMPRDIKWDEEMETIEPHVDVESSTRAWRQSVNMGNARVVIHARRIAVRQSSDLSYNTKFLEHGQWITFDHYMRNRALCAWFLNRGDPAEAWIVRRQPDPRWTINQTAQESDLELEEVQGP